MKDLFKQIPSVDKLLNDQSLEVTLTTYGQKRTTDAVRALIGDLRSQIASGERADIPAFDSMAEDVKRMLNASDHTSLTPVMNLTGTVLHTNLGRAYLPESAIAAITRIATGASNLEFDLDSGARGDRDDHISDLIAELTGAEAATVVNNNAAAVMLCLNTLALGKKVCVSRGELVEIGGSFRIPEIMSRSGSELAEVGATNRTHLKDYAAAIDADTAAVMKVHTSNYEIQGFTAEVSYSELAALAHEHNLPCLVDLGSGNLVELGRYGLAHEPTVAEVLASGADLVTFSGDKLLGGPQAGIIAGTRELVDQVKKNPLKRALRVDKMTIAALNAVLSAYRTPETLEAEIPTLRFLSRTADDVEQLVDTVLPVFRAFLGDSGSAEKVESESQIGSGALPLNTLPSFSISITPAEPGETALQAIVTRFRQLDMPVIGRLQEGRLLFDLRTLPAAEDLTTLLSN